ncbi:DUF6585 family protein [Streptomyces sp. NPDC047971]|uniref:DUF6585 family protein n=1 Tax=Streptomyces sp. NPDC047971 TaxID=3154499 RepID=UPI0033E12767
MTGSGTAAWLGAQQATYVAIRPPWTGYVLGGIVLLGGGTPLLITMVVALGASIPLLAFSLMYVAFGWMLIDKIRLARRGKDARLDLFQHGAVVTTHDGKAHTFGWDSVQVHQDVLHSRKNGITESSHVYTLIGEDGMALTIGDTRRTSTSRYAGIVTHVQGAEFTDPEQWGPAIVQAVSESQLRGAMEDVARGQELIFNTIRLSLNGVEFKGRTLPWARIRDMRPVNGRLHVKEEGRRLLAMDVPVSSIPNFPVFSTVAKRLHEATRQS